MNAAAHLVREWLSRVSGAVTGRRRDRDLEDELATHRALAEEDARQRGHTVAEAYRIAGSRSGTVAHALDAMKDQRGLPWLDDFRRDVAHSLRMLSRARGFAATTILMLAVGIGANTAIFSLLDALVFRPLPVAKPEELVIVTNPLVGGAAGGLRLGERAHVTFNEFQTLRDEVTSFSGMFATAGYVSAFDARIDDGAAEPLKAKLVSGSYFDVLGVPPMAGRTFTASDERGPGTAPYVVISDGYWERRFNRDPGALNARVRVADASLTIIGVAPPWFTGDTVGERPDAWIPTVMQPQLMPGANWLGRSNMMWLHAVGRLTDGATIQRAQAEADVTLSRMLQELSQRVNPRIANDVLQQHLTLHDASRGISPLRGTYSTALYTLMGLVGLVLLIACSSVATLLLAKAGEREKEFGIRLAIGAGRFRLFRQLATESLVISTIASLVATGLAIVAVRLLVSAVLGGDDGVPGVTVGELGVRPDLRVLLFTGALCVVTVFVFGLVPSWRAARDKAGPSSQQQVHATARRVRRVHFNQALVTWQVVVSVVLLVGAGWFVRTFRNLESADLGFSREIVQVTVGFRDAGYDAAGTHTVRDLVRERLAALPGVRAVAYSATGLLGDNYIPIAVEGFQPSQPSDSIVKLVPVSPDYFSSLGIPLVSGRQVDRRDTPDARLVCVINESFAKAFFPGKDPIGQVVVLGNDRFAIIGVARDSRDTLTYPLTFAENLKAPVARTFYPAAAQAERARPVGSANYQLLPNGESLDLSELRDAVRTVNAALTVSEPQPLDGVIAKRLKQERLIAQLASIIGGVAILLACVGLYGLLSHTVIRRTNEIGIRVALGAQRGEVVGMVLRELAILVTLGIAIGVPLSMGASGLVRSQLYGLTPADLPTLIGAIVLTCGVAAVAGYLPARRAARINPLVAIRTE